MQDGHFFGEIPGRFLSIEAYRDLVEAHPIDRPGIFVEVGTREGASTAYFGIETVNAGKTIAMHVVGDWADDEEEKAFGATVGRRLKKAGVVVRQWPGAAPGGAAAAEKFKDGSIDLVWILADWRIPNPAPIVEAALAAWRPKVRPGGVIGGDGWNVPGVRAVVAEAAGGPVSPLLETHRGRAGSAYWKITIA